MCAITLWNIICGWQNLSFAVRLAICAFFSNGIPNIPLLWTHHRLIASGWRTVCKLCSEKKKKKNSQELRSAILSKTRPTLEFRRVHQAAAVMTWFKEPPPGFGEYFSVFGCVQVPFRDSSVEVNAVLVRLRTRFVAFWLIHRKSCHLHFVFVYQSSRTKSDVPDWAPVCPGHNGLCWWWQHAWTVFVLIVFIYLFF